MPYWHLRCMYCMLHWIRSDVANSSLHSLWAFQNSCLFQQYLALVPVGFAGAHILSLYSGPTCQKLIYSKLFPQAFLHYCNLHFVLPRLCFPNLLFTPAQVSHCIQIISFASWETLTNPKGSALEMLKCVINMLTTALSLLPVQRQINPVHTLTPFFC